MRNKAGLVFMLLLIAMLMASAFACSGQKATPTPQEQKKNFEVDYKKIAGDTPETRVDSLVSLLNGQTEGFAKLFSRVVKTEGETPEQKGAIYSYNLVAYGDATDGMEDYSNKILVIVKQVVAYTAKFIVDPSEQSMIQVLVTLPEAENHLFTVMPTSISAVKNAPTESWMSLAEAAQMELVSVEWLQQVQAFIEQNQPQPEGN